MDFETAYTVTEADGGNLEYGVVFGGNNIVFIKSGAGSTCRGYENKYVEMARRLNKRCNFTVICAPNPGPIKTTYEIDKLVIKKVIEDKKIDNYTLSLFGSSNGCYQNIFLAEAFPSAVKMLSVNMPLMVNFQKATEKLSKFPLMEKIFIYGRLDPSVTFIPLLEAKRIDNLTVKIVEGADHQFKNMLDDFIALSDLI